MWLASSPIRLAMADGNRWMAGGPFAAASSSAGSIAAIVPASSVPIRSRSIFGAENAHCTGTCWSSAKPMRSAIGSLTSS